MSLSSRTPVRALMSLFVSLSVLSAWIVLPLPARAESTSDASAHEQVLNTMTLARCDQDSDQSANSKLCFLNQDRSTQSFDAHGIRLHAQSATEDHTLHLNAGYEIEVAVADNLLALNRKTTIQVTAHTDSADQNEVAPTALSIHAQGERRLGAAIENNVGEGEEAFRGFALDATQEELAAEPMRVRFSTPGIRLIRIQILDTSAEDESKLIAEAEFMASIEEPAKNPQALQPAPAPSTEETAGAETSAQTSQGSSAAQSRSVREAQPLPQTAASRALTIDHGHIDLFYMTLDGSGHPLLKILEDVTGSGVEHEAEDVRLVVPASAWTQSLPGEIAGGKGYFLPQTQDSKLPWPGWDILALAPAGFERVEFDVTYTNPNGGRISMWIEDFVAGRSSRLRSGGFDLDPQGATIVQDYLSHTHANWVFSQAGTYELSVQARAYRNDGSFETTRTAHYLIEVGSASGSSNQQTSQNSAVSPGASSDAAGPQSARTVEEQLQRDAPQRPGAQRCIPTRITREATEDEVSRIGTDNETPNQATTVLNVQVGNEGGITDGHFDLGPAIENGQLVARIKDDRSVPALWKDPASLTFALGDKARIKAPDALNFVANPGQDVWMIPATQIRGVPWLGMNSQREEIVTGTSGQVRFSLLDVRGPGNVAVFESGTLGAGIGTHVFDGAGTAYTLPANTHAHQNWVFTEPGSYQLTIAMSVNPRGGDLRGSGNSSSSSLVAAGGTGEHGRPMVYAVVGRTATGEPCNLASTGSSSQALLPTIVAAAFMGAVCLVFSSRPKVRR